MKAHHLYTEEEKQFLRNNISQCTYQELTDIFNAKFGTDVSKYSISDVCIKRMGIRRNQNTGTFKVGARRQKAAPIGAERDFNGYIFVKVADTYFPGTTSYEEFTKNWRCKQRVIYEQAYGKIPEGNIVIFLDNNNRNFSIDNLYCIDRKIHACMCKRRWYTSDRDITLAAIKWCELYYALLS